MREIVTNDTVDLEADLREQIKAVRAGSGAAIYLFQVPERWWPGHFDYFFSSHQLWHLSIFAAVLVHYFALIHMYEWRMSRECTNFFNTLAIAMNQSIARTLPAPSAACMRARTRIGIIGISGG
jgi:hypothetical protein